MTPRAQPASGALDEPVDVSVEVRARCPQGSRAAVSHAAPDHNESVCWRADAAGRRTWHAYVKLRGYPAAVAARASTSIVPIVINNAGDPVKTGLVASLNRSGDNITGISDVNRKGSGAYDPNDAAYSSRRGD
jgi:hypothetical protein